MANSKQHTVNTNMNPSGVVRPLDRLAEILSDKTTSLPVSIAVETTDANYLVKCLATDITEKRFRVVMPNGNIWWAAISCIKDVVIFFDEVGKMAFAHSFADESDVNIELKEDRIAA